jgi:hypothetical protein
MLEQNMKKHYEAWSDLVDNCICISFFETGTTQFGISEKAKLLYRIEADTYEEAHAVHHIKMGWEPYVPIGNPHDCPNSCGAVYYPEGSGECPNCGKLC